MGENSIKSITSILPEKVVYDAASRYIVKLSQADAMEEATRLYEKLFALDICHESLGEAGRSLIARHIARREIGLALGIYESFPVCANLSEKLKSCHLLVFTLLWDDLKKALDLWLEFQNLDLNEEEVWQWLETGLGLLKGCHKNGMTDTAEEICKAMCSKRSCESVKGLLARADSLMKKIVKCDRRR